MMVRNSKSTLVLASAFFVVLALAVGCGTAKNNNQAEKSDTNAESSSIGMVQPQGEVAFSSGSDEANTYGLSVGGASCRIELPVCAKGKVAAKVVNETVATAYGSFLPLLQLGSPYQAEACRLRAVQ